MKKILFIALAVVLFAAVVLPVHAVKAESIVEILD